jgi:hypothetical protein
VFEFENGRVYRGRFEQDRMADLPAVDPVGAPIASAAATASKPATAANSKPATAGMNGAAATSATANAASSMFSASAAANTTGIASYLAPTAAGTFDLAISDLLEECADAGAEREAVNNVLLRFNSELRAAYRYYACHFSSASETAGDSAAMNSGASAGSLSASGDSGFANGSAAAAAAIRAVLEHTSSSAEESSSSAARDDAKAALGIHETRALRAREEAVLRHVGLRWEDNHSHLFKLGIFSIIIHFCYT